MGTGVPTDSHPRFRRLADYLAAKAPPGKLPGRQHIDPVDLFDILPYLMLIDVIRGEAPEPRYRIRLMGTEVAALTGMDGTGKFVEEVLTDPEESRKVISGYSEILKTREPQYRRGMVASTDRKHMYYERIAFPLAADGETVDMFIFVFGHTGQEAMPADDVPDDPPEDPGGPL